MPRAGSTPFRSTGNRLQGTAGAKGAQFLLPAPGQSTGASKSGGVRYQWQGQAAVGLITNIMLRGFQQLAAQAENYWNTVEWTKERHPEMTGAMRDAGSFTVSESGNRVMFVFRNTSPHAAFEEWGTRFRPSHAPMRNTLDKVVYRASDIIRAAAKG